MNKTRLAEMAAKRKAIEAEIAKIKESRVPGIARLIESELERAEVVLAAKSVTAKLQDMAEDLAKIEADDLLPMLDQLTAEFGPEMAERFSRITSEKVRAAVENMRATKEALNAEVDRMERILNGEDPSDMAREMEAPVPAADDMEDVSAQAMADIQKDTDQEDAPAKFDLDDDGQHAAGRARKESLEPAGVSALRESTDPDSLLRRRLASLVTEGMSPMAAAKKVADDHGVDLGDVVECMREAAEGDGDQQFTVTFYCSTVADGVRQAVSIAKEQVGTGSAFIRVENTDTGKAEEFDAEDDIKESATLVEFKSTDFGANLSRLATFDSRLGDMAKQIDGMISSDEGLTGEEKSALANVLSHFAASAEDQSGWDDPEDVADKAFRAVSHSLNPRKPEAKKIVNMLKKLAHAIGMKHEG